MAKVSKKRTASHTKKGGKTRKAPKKRVTKKIRPESHKEIKVEKVLVENFIGLQRVMVNLSAKFDNLSMQIAKLLELFEISAKSLAQQDTITGKEDKDSKMVLEKLDNLSQQAGLIGKGLSLIHQVNSEGRRTDSPPKRPMPPRQSQSPRPPLPPSKQSPPPSRQSQSPRPPLPPSRQQPMNGQSPQGQPPPGRKLQGYQRSISSRTPEEDA
ncbi:MAG TPA: hypothetical protein ENH99_01200 [Candidatus Pacearchaeota archaeon]|nr:hypothetical protein [Candidatus Pacearchaeota archaeon]